MALYLALLRGINVSGKKIIKMEDLRKLMENAGYTKIKTYIQSGNVVFESTEKVKKQIAKKLNYLLNKIMGLMLQYLY